MIRNFVIALIILLSAPAVHAYDWHIDLVPTRIAPGAGEAGYWHNVYIYATNTGNLCTNSPVDVLVDVFNPDGTYEGTYYTIINPWLQPGEERSNFIRFYAEEEGIYRLHVDIDYQDDYPEKNEENNVDDFYFETYIMDTDGDGVKDPDDACVNTPGTDCNGCPDYCAGCSVMSCEYGALTPPTCVPQDSLCADTVCPSDGCYTSFCDLDERTLFDQSSVSNHCSLDTSNHGVCSENECTYTCEHDESCDVDDDNDGVNDDDDLCPDTPFGEKADNEGCSCSQKTCNDGNSCTDDHCDIPSGYCWFQIDNTNTCGSSRDCPSNRCEGEILYRYPDDGHDYCRAGECIQYECTEDAMYSYECDSDDDNDGDPDDTDCEPLVPQIHHGAEELCNNLDDDCDGVIDMMTESCSGNNEGICSAGERTCTHGNWGQCIGAVGPEQETCDGLDNDCDGQTDEGCPCTVGETQDCPLQDGVCSGAVQTCTSSGWSVCQYGPDYELDESSCDGLDNDCDGQTDMMERDCSLSYYGLCADGTETCFGGSWTGCPAPADEICDGLYDEDCDNVVDNDCDCTDGESRLCGSDVGLCQSGLQSCSSGTWGLCVGETGPSDEICGGMYDEDCDGIVDNGCDCTDGLSEICGTDVGACEFGLRSCSFGSWSSCIGGIEPVTEVCNGIDDDCDGSVDENCDCIEGQTMACGTSAGACEWGMRACVGGSWGECIGGSSPSVETCNGIDDDCDGRVDEGVCNDPERDDVYVSSISFLNGDWLKPGDELVVVVTIRNRGNSDLENVRITGYVDDIGLRYRVGPFDVNDGNSASKTLRFDIPDWADIGLYDLRVSISSDQMRRIKYRSFAVVDRELYCGDPVGGRYCSIFA